MAATQTHATPSSTRIQRTETDGQRLLHTVYDGGIMWKLGLNKAPVGQSPRERSILWSELVQLELRGGRATTHTHTHTTALHNPELLCNDVSNKHSESNKYTTPNK